MGRSAEGAPCAQARVSGPRWAGASGSRSDLFHFPRFDVVKGGQVTVSATSSLSAAGLVLCFCSPFVVLNRCVLRPGLPGAGRTWAGARRWVGRRGGGRAGDSGPAGLRTCWRARGGDAECRTRGSFHVRRGLFRLLSLPEFRVGPLFTVPRPVPSRVCSKTNPVYGDFFLPMSFRGRCEM